ncbi:MFS transporter [Rhodococcus artemisiae]|uniref:MFS transporter n=1 Tax=Rhodococcus artemisiae TaxID=714159 RepID=A0ABU7LBA6_9NOCA|nr:MFS transporter [Rhodococcus artemisiae]MEE2058197.1 MFS transporter [Rhodococcus artemisiae]
MPLYGLYALLFEDHGLSTGSISSLFVLWSVVAFVSEVPSGAWADTVSRRGLLLGSGVLFTATFTIWMVWPTVWGFAAGFVLWGVSESLKSGTFEALLYDELAALDAEHRYAAVMGYANAGEMVCVFVAILSASPLFGLGGYALVGWLSVAITVANMLLVLTLPCAPCAMEADELDGTGDTATSVPPPSAVLARYVSALRDGTTEVRTDKVVRRAVVLAAALLACLAFDEYFGLLAREGGATIEQVPVLVALTVVGQVIGAAAAGRTASMSGRVMSAVVIAGAMLLAAGAMVGGVVGFIAIGFGYGALQNTAIVAEARLQDTMSGRTRATVTSVVGLTSEVMSVAVFAWFAVGSAWIPLSALVVSTVLPLLVVGITAVRWLPDRGSSAAS